MTESERPTRLLLVALLMAGLLLAGRTALAVHDYGHDLAQGDPECEVCDLGHFFKSDLVQVRATPPALAYEAPRAPIERITLLVFAHAPYLSRAPPSIRI